MRQYEIRKRLDEVYKVELVRRVRVSRHVPRIRLCFYELLRNQITLKRFYTHVVLEKCAFLGEFVLDFCRFLINAS